MRFKNLAPDVLYKVNIYAIVRDLNNQEIESDNLHNKVVVLNERLSVYSETEETWGQTTSRQVSLNPEHGAPQQK